MNHSVTPAGTSMSSTPFAALMRPGFSASMCQFARSAEIVFEEQLARGRGGAARENQQRERR